MAPSPIPLLILSLVIRGLVGFAVGTTVDFQALPACATPIDVLSGCSGIFGRLFSGILGTIPGDLGLFNPFLALFNLALLLGVNGSLVWSGMTWLRGD